MKKLDFDVSILIFLDSSFLCIPNTEINFVPEMSQSLFSWIHLSYRGKEVIL